MWRAILSVGDGARRGCAGARLDGHRKNLLVPVSLEQSFGVRAVVLAPASIRPYEVRWEQDDVVSQPSQRPCPEVSRAAGFEKHGGSALFRKKRHQLGSTHTELLGHLPRFARDGNLEDVLCKTHSDRRIFHSDSSFFDAFFRLTLAHRCRLCQRRSPSHHLMAEAPASPSLSGAKRPRFHRLARGNVCLTKSRSATVNRDQSGYNDANLTAMAPPAWAEVIGE